MNRVREEETRDLTVLAQAARYVLEMPPDPEHQLYGKQIGPYWIIDLIGQGGMGSVYRARHEQMTRIVALKIIRPERVSALTRALFEKEFEIQSRLDHEGIVTIFEAGRHPHPDTGTPMICVAMQYVPRAVTIDQHAHSQTRRATLEIMIEVLKAVQYAHERQVVHRDLKPANILVNNQQRPLIIDFGLACLTEDATFRYRNGAGTARYMSPEQYDNRLGPIGATSDVFTIGLILTELLTLDDIPETPRRLSADNAGCWARPMLDSMEPTLAKLIRKSLQLRPHLRYRSAVEMKRALEDYLTRYGQRLARTVPPQPVIRREGGRIVTFSWSGPSVRDRHFEELGIHTHGQVDNAEELRNLISLSLNYTNVSGGFLDTLPPLVNLRSLSLIHTQITDDALKSISHSPRLLKLRLSQTDITDLTVAQLATLGELEMLDLRGTQIGDGAVKYLCSLPKLRRLERQHTRLTAVGLERLKQQLPALEIA